MLRFALFFLIFEAAIFLVLWREPIFRPYAGFNAKLAAAVLSPFVDGTTAQSGFLSAPGFAIQVRPGCDAYQASAVLLAGIAAFPASARKKLAGALVGVAALCLLNVVRLAAILLTGIHRPALFDAMHLEIMPGVFMVSALVLWLAWAQWTRARAAPAGS